MSEKLPSIAFFMHDLSGGGVERMRLRLATALATRGHPVTLIVQMATGALRSCVPDGIDLIELRQPRTWRLVPALVRVLKRLRPDFLISSLDHNNVAALCARVLAGPGAHLIICQHNSLSAEKASAGWRYRLVPPLYHLLSPWAMSFLAVSEGVADDLAVTAGLSRARITVIHNPVTPDWTVPSTDDPPHPWLADKDIPVFLFVGRLVKQKDPTLLLRAFVQRARHSPARLIFLGDGPLLRPLAAEAEARGVAHVVHFAGFVADPLPWMDHATALVLPSRYEGFGNVLVEALSRGTPVIATTCPYGPDEILAGGRFGWLVPVGDEMALAEAMKDDVRASFPAARLKQRAQAFTVSVCASRHQALFRRILGAKPRVFGLDLSRLDAHEIANRLLREDLPREVRTIVTPNLDHVRLMRRLPEFNAACRAADIACADGFSVARYARWRGAIDGRRMTGCDIFQAVVAHEASCRRKVLVVTECEPTAQALRAWSAARHDAPCWQAVTASARLLSHIDAQHALVSKIADVRPDILIMSIGAPTSEIFVHRHRRALPPCWVLCCGQAVRVELGLARRAPPAMQKLNLEWAWRLLHEPGRLGPRYCRDALAVPGLIWADLRDAMRRRRAAKLHAPAQDQPGA